MLDFNIPEKFAGTLYVCLGVGSYVKGELSVSGDKPSGKGSWGKIAIKEVPLEFDLSIDPVLLQTQILAALQEEKADVLAEQFQKVKEIDDKIQSLLAIEYKPEVEVESEIVVETPPEVESEVEASDTNSIPF